MAAQKKLALEGGKFARGDTPDETPLTTAEQFRERAAACLEEAARSQSPLNTAYKDQAQVWLEMAAQVTK